MQGQGFICSDAAKCDENCSAFKVLLFSAQQRANVLEISNHAYARVRTFITSTPINFPTKSPDCDKIRLAHIIPVNLTHRLIT